MRKSQYTCQRLREPRTRIPTARTTHRRRTSFKPQAGEKDRTEEPSPRPLEQEKEVWRLEAQEERQIGCKPTPWKQQKKPRFEEIQDVSINRVREGNEHFFVCGEREAELSRQRTVLLSSLLGLSFSRLLPRCVVGPLPPSLRD